MVEEEASNTKLASWEKFRSAKPLTSSLTGARVHLRKTPKYLTSRREPGLSVFCESHYPAWSQLLSEATSFSSSGHEHLVHPTMSFLFGGGRPAPSSAEKIAAAEAELELFSDMFNRSVLSPPSHFKPFLPTSLLSQPFPSLVGSCSKKCIQSDYREAELNKGESVCLDRCVAKFFEVNVKVSEKMQKEAQEKQASGGGSLFGM